MNQRIRLTKQLLHNTLLQMLAAQPLEKISIKALCEQAGINRSTFYAHYGSTRDVLLEIEEEINHHIMTICQNQKLKTREKLVRICEYLYQEKQTELLLFQNHIDGDLSRIFEIINEELRPLRNLTGSEEEEALTLAFVNYGMFYLLKTWLQDDINKTPTEITDLLLDQILKLPV